MVPGISRVLQFCVICFFCAGCATSMVANLTKHEQGYTPSGNPNVGLIYFYRESEFAGSLRCVFVNVNGERKGALNSGTYFVYEAPPGETTVSAEDRLGEDPARTIQIEAGEKYYVKGGVKMGIWDADPYINIVAPEEGAGAVAQLTYATMKEKDLK